MLQLARDSGAAVAVVGLLVVERQGAGLEGWSLAIGLSALVPLLLLAQAWRLPGRILALAAALPASVLAVAVLAPGGSSGVERAGIYAYGALAGLAAAAWARGARRRTATGVMLVLLVFDQFSQAWLPWWGSENPYTLMIGTFYWHNQFGAFCMGGAAVALALGHLGGGRVRLVALIGGSFAVVGVLLSGSRASAFALAVAWAVVIVLGARAHGARAALARSAQAVGAAMGVGLLFVSPIFFPRWGLPWGPLGERLEEGSLGGNSDARWEFWRAGLRVFLGHPFTGPGLDTYSETSRAVAPIGVGLSADPHNEVVRGFAEGGLIGGIPLLAVVGFGLVMGLRSVRAATEGQALRDDPGRWAALVAAAALTVHALVDFDWSYPALTALAGVAFGTAAAPLLPDPDRSRSRWGGPRWATVVGSALLLTAVASALAGTVFHYRAEAALATDGLADDREALVAWAPDHRLAFAVLRGGVVAGRGNSREADRMLQLLQRRLSIDDRTAADVVPLLSAAGRHDEAVDLARSSVARVGERRTRWDLVLATALANAGDPKQAAEVAARAVVRQAGQESVPAVQREGALLAAASLVAGSSDEQECVRALDVAGAARTQVDLPAACLTFR